jgi:uncharacterized protein (DUF1778 family)
MHLDIAVTSDLQQLIQAAAAISGRSVDDFVIDAVAETSRRVLAGETVTVLTDRDRNRFLELLDQPADPNAALRAAAERCWPQS